MGEAALPEDASPIGPIRKQGSWADCRLAVSAMETYPIQVNAFSDPSNASPDWTSHQISIAKQLKSNSHYSGAEDHRQNVQIPSNLYN